MEDSFKQFRFYPEKEGKKFYFFTSLQEFHSNSSCRISRVVNTESNVGFTVLNKLLKCFALEQFPEHWKDYKHPEPNLKDSLGQFLKLRNAVAHGNDLDSEEKITREKYIKYKNLVKDLMYDIRLKMSHGLEQKTFLKIQQNTIVNNEQ